jgi:DnaJ-class molecular chaperone
MTIRNPYVILNIPIDSSIEDVKKAYKNIALKSHPDKLNNISDINEKNKKIKYFMDATNAYNLIIKNNGKIDSYDMEYDDCDINFNDVSYDDWMETFNNITKSELFKEVCNMFMKFKNRIKKHNINVDIKYSDYFNVNKKKLRIFLKNLNEPVYINLDCKKYPKHIINYFDENDNEHEITINMNLINDIKINNGFYHLDESNNNIKYNENNIDENNSIDGEYENNEENNNQDKYNIYYDMNIDTIDYILGDTKELIFVNKEIINIEIIPFEDKYIKKGFGINGGDLIINFIYKPIKKEKWDKILDADKNEMVRIFKYIKNDIKI